jgi:hypothetical protein
MQKHSEFCYPDLGAEPQRKLAITTGLVGDCHAAVGPSECFWRCRVTNAHRRRACKTFYRGTTLNWDRANCAMISLACSLASSRVDPSDILASINAFTARANSASACKRWLSFASVMALVRAPRGLKQTVELSKLH